jgi:hypothetical protein
LFVCCNTTRHFVKQTNKKRRFFLVITHAHTTLAHPRKCNHKRKKKPQNRSSTRNTSSYLRMRTRSQVETEAAIHAARTELHMREDISVHTAYSHSNTTLLGSLTSRAFHARCPRPIQPRLVADEDVTHRTPMQKRRRRKLRGLLKQQKKKKTVQLLKLQLT